VKHKRSKDASVCLLHVCTPRLSTQPAHKATPPLRRHLRHSPAAAVNFGVVEDGRGPAAGSSSSSLRVGSSKDATLQHTCTATNAACPASVEIRAHAEKQQVNSAATERSAALAHTAPSAPYNSSAPATVCAYKQNPTLHIACSPTSAGAGYFRPFAPGRPDLRAPCG
jgi:hypothetical protein